MACPIPDCGPSGATTTTSPISLTTSINARIPGAEMPSSFDTNINGLFIIESLYHKFTKRKLRTYTFATLCQK